MFSKSANLALAAVIFLLGRIAWAEPGSGTAQTPRLDTYGDPLPHGALLRLGTTRLHHGDFVNRVAFSPNGKMIVSCSWDRTLRSWETATGKELHCFQGHQDAVMSLSISKDGKTLASISQDHTIRIWDLAAGKELHKRDASRGGYHDVAFSPDGQILASCGQHIRIWETKTYQVIREFEKVQKLVYCISFSPDGKTLAAGDEHGEICFWETTHWKETRRVKAHTKGVQSLAFSPNGKFLASAGDDGLLALRNPETGEEIRALCKRERGGARLAFSPDSKMVACSWTAEGAVRLFEVSSGKEIGQLHGLSLGINDLAFSPDGKSIASAANSTIRLHDLQTGKEILPFPSPRSPVSSVAFCLNDTILASADWEATIHCWDPVRGKELEQLKGHSQSPWFLAASPDSQTLLSAGRDGFVRRWDPAKGKELRAFHLDEAFAPRAVSPNGKLLAAQDFSLQTGRVYNLLTGKEMCRFGPASDIIFLPDGKSLMLLVPDQGLIRWDIASGKLVARLPGDTRQNTCLAVSPDGKIFASGTANNCVHRWDLRSGEALSSLDGPHKYIYCLAFSPDGRTLASGGKDGSIYLWEMVTGQKRLVLRGHKGPVLSLDFTRDGRRLASCSKDATVLIWDVSGGIGVAAPAKELAAAQLEDLWRDLAGADTANAYRAQWTLITCPAQSIPYLASRLHPTPAVDAQRVVRLLADLDDDSFQVRSKAQRALEELGESTESLLHTAAKKQTSAEVQRQIKHLLAKIQNERKTPSADSLRIFRAIEVLEQCNTPGARDLLKTLADGATAARQTEEAKASLDRLLNQAKRVPRN